MRLRLSSLALLFCFLASVASGQITDTTTGAINGVVVDGTGSPTPGVTVTVTSTDTGLKRNVVTDGDGIYTTNLLPPGRYRVDAELTGLGKAAASEVEVLLGRSTKVDLKLATQVTETVNVTAATPLVDTGRTATTMSITSEQIQNLPLIGRDFRSLAQLTPGVVDSFGGRITANGARGVATDYNIDGATSNNDFFGENTGGTRAPFTFSQAAIKEFQVVRSQYDAEFGRGVGAQLNAITKSGSNDVSGEVFLFGRRREWARERSKVFDNGEVVTDPFRAKDSTQTGFAIGGPIVRNKLFFFGNFDAQRQKLPVATTSLYDTDATRTDTFASLSPALQQQFVAKLEAFLGHPYSQELSYDQTFNQNTYLGKVDWNWGANTRISLRDNYTNFENANNQTIRHLSNQGVEHDKFNQFVGQASMSLSPSMLNLLTVQHSKDERPIDPVATGPEISVSNLFSAGGTFFGKNDGFSNNTKESKIQIKDTVQSLHGRHNLKAGFDLLFMNIDNLFPRNRDGVYRYNNAQLFVNGTPSSYLQGYGPGGGLTKWSQNTFAFFAADNFRLNPKLTIDVGVRYDWQTMPLPETNVFPLHPEFITDIKEDKDNVAPRLAAAYDLGGDGKSVLRGGTGIFFGYMPDILLSNPLTQISGNFNQITITCSATTPCPTFPNILTPEQFNPLVRTSSDVVVISPDYQAQQAWRSNVQYERQLPGGFSVGAGVIYSKLTNVQGSRNVNATKSGVMLGNLPHYDLLSGTRKYPDLNAVRELCSCEEADFKALTLETHKLAVGGSRLSWDLSYTLSKAVDQDSNERSTSSSFLFDPNNPALSEGPGDNDVRHRLVGDITYRTIWGVSVAGIAQFRTGVPYNGGITFTGTGVPGSPNSLSGLASTSGNIPVFVDGNGAVIDLTLANNTSRAQFAQFLADRGATIIGRNAFRQPSFFNIDLRIAKTFELSDRTRVELIAEVFNLTNKENRFITETNQNNFGAAYTQATDRYTFTKNPKLGFVNAYLGSSDPTQFQVAAKLRF
jgi:hypothetical protein